MEEKGLPVLTPHADHPLLAAIIPNYAGAAFAIIKVLLAAAMLWPSLLPFLLVTAAMACGLGSVSSSAATKNTSVVYNYHWEMK